MNRRSGSGRVTGWAAVIALTLGGAVASAQAPMDEDIRRVPRIDRPEYQWTPLHWAARYDAADEIRGLMERGANLEARDFLGRTPLHVAALFGQEEAVRMLLEAGADANARDRWGVTPLRRLELLAESRGVDRPVIAGLLRRAGAKSP